MKGSGSVISEHDPSFHFYADFIQIYLTVKVGKKVKSSSLLSGRRFHLNNENIQVTLTSENCYFALNKISFNDETVIKSVVNHPLLCFLSK